MKVLVIVKATKRSEEGCLPSEQLLTEMGKFNEELARAGLLVMGEGLLPSSHGKRVRFSGQDRLVTDGPFAETNELVAGFWIWQVASIDEAVDWVKRCPNPMNEESDIEIRPIHGMEVFGDAFTPELREQEAAIRAQSLGLGFPGFVSMDARTIAGINRTYTLESRVAIPEQWCQFVPRLGGISGQLGPDTFGVCWNYVTGKGFDYLTGISVGPDFLQPDDFTSVSLPAGRYVVFEHQGHVSTLPKSIDAIWTKWLPECGFRAVPAPSFERYTEEFNGTTGMGGMEIWIPIESASAN